MATILSTTLLNLFLIPSFFLALLLTPACKGDNLLTPACKANNILYGGETLRTDEYLEHGNYRFIIQGDCNLVLYDTGSPVWASHTDGLARNCYCTLHTFGNLVIYDPNGGALWATNTSGHEALYVLILQKDRNVIIYGGPLWANSTNVCGSSATPVVTVVRAATTNHTA